MEVRKSAKIAIGIVAALGTIGALHLFIFKDKAAQYEQAKARYDSAVSEFSTQGTAPSIDEINKFEYQSLKYQLMFWRTVSDMRLALDPRYELKDGALPPESEQRQHLWNYLRELERFRAEGNAGQKPKLLFMDERVPAVNIGWDMATALPQGLVQANVAPEDVLTRLRNQDKLLQSLDPNMPVFQPQQNQYFAFLNQLGLNLQRRDLLAREFGPAFATIYTLNRIDQVMKNLPADYWARMNEQERLEEMYRLFRIEWPKDLFGNVSIYMGDRQFMALLDIIGMARRHGVDDIIRVRLFETRAVTWEPPKTEEELKAAAAQPQGGMMMDEFMDPTMMGFEDEGGRGGMSFGGFGRSAATPTPVAVSDALATPMEIWMRGTNASVMSTLYEIAHSRIPYEIDRVRFLKASNDQDLIVAVAYVNLPVYALGVGVVNQADVDCNIAATLNRLSTLLDRKEVQQMAISEGLARMVDGRAQLVEPVPTMCPATPTPTPDPNQMANMGQEW